MKPDNFGKVESVSLHYFFDVSELGFEHFNYIRWSMKQGEFIADCYCENQELLLRSLYQSPDWS